jgi:restriction endonuclease
VQHTLAPLGFTLTRVGRSNDAGIDLLGYWALPQLPAPMRVVVQCKSHARPLRPEHVRELEGAVENAPHGWRGALGLLIGPREASRGVRERVGASKSAVGFVMMDGGVGGNGSAVGIGVLGNNYGKEGEGEEDRSEGDVRHDGMVTKEGKVRQFLWNWVAQERGLQGLGVTVKYTPTEGPKGKELDREIALTWNGWMIKKLTEGTSPESTTPSIEAEIANSSEEPAPKKRGRPRKNVLDEKIAVSQTAEKKQKKSAKATTHRGQKKKK